MKKSIGEQVFELWVKSGGALPSGYIGRSENNLGTVTGSVSPNTFLVPKNGTTYSLRITSFMSNGTWFVFMVEDSNGCVLLNQLSSIEFRAYSKRDTQESSFIGSITADSSCFSKLDAKTFINYPITNGGDSALKVYNYLVSCLNLYVWFIIKPKFK